MVQVFEGMCQKISDYVKKSVINDVNITICPFRILISSLTRVDLDHF